MRPMKSLALLLSFALATTALAGQRAGAPPPVRFRVVLLETPARPGRSATRRRERSTRAARRPARCSWPAAPTPRAGRADGKLADLGTTGGCSYSWASAICDAGTVVGTSMLGGPDNAFRWTPASGNRAARPAPQVLSVRGPPDGTIAFTAILPGAQAVGAVWNPAWGVRRIAVPAGDVHVRDLAASGAVAGLASFPGLGTHAFRWTAEDGLLDLGVPAGFTISHAYGLNDNGVVVGLSRSSSVDPGDALDVGVGPTPLAYARPTSSQSAAYAVNAQGWIVGSEYETIGSFLRPLRDPVGRRSALRAHEPAAAGCGPAQGARPDRLGRERRGPDRGARHRRRQGRARLAARSAVARAQRRSTPATGAPLFLAARRAARSAREGGGAARRRSAIDSSR